MTVHDKIIKDLVISGYSGGAGKTFLVRKVLALNSPSMSFSISTTTRPPRKHDKEGVDYHFVDVETFRAMIDNNEFIEYSNPREGIFYGTTFKEYRRIKDQGKALAFDVDYEGVRQLKEKLGDTIYAVLLKPTVSTRILWMRKRGDMSAEEMLGRIEYSESVERPFFEQYEGMLFDRIMDPYNNELEKVPFLVNEISNALVVM